MVKKPLPKPLYGGLKVLCDNLNLGLCVHLRRISFLLLFFFFFYYTPSCQHHNSIFIIRCLHDATQLGKAEDRSGVPTSVLRSSIVVGVSMVNVKSL